MWEVLKGLALYYLGPYLTMARAPLRKSTMRTLVAPKAAGGPIVMRNLLDWIGCCAAALAKEPRPPSLATPQRHKHWSDIIAHRHRHSRCGQYLVDYSPLLLAGVPVMSVACTSSRQVVRPHTSSRRHLLSSRLIIHRVDEFLPVQTSAQKPYKRSRGHSNTSSASCHASHRATLLPCSFAGNALTRHQ